MTTQLTPTQARTKDTRFLQAFSLHALRSKLPLRIPADPRIPPSPKNEERYRSHYVYDKEAALKDLEEMDKMNDFDLLLRLVDFSSFRDTLAYLLGWTSGKGYPPFDPVSLLLLHFWQIFNGWNRAQTLRNLQDSRYADYARLFGFDDNFPTEGGLRHFLTSLGRPLPSRDILVEVPSGEDGETPEKVSIHRLNYLLSQAVNMFWEAGMIEEKAWKNALVTPDGMIHPAASRMRCPFVTDVCYGTPANGDSAPRRCPAKERGFEGVDEETLKKEGTCPRATPRDPDARTVLYQGNNRKDGKSESDGKKCKKGKSFFGYRSIPLQLSVPDWRFHITLLSHFQPANLREEVPATALLMALPHFYPTLRVDAVAGDAGFGYEVFLSAVYQMGARRVVDLRAHETDEDRNAWIMRKYDDKGRPLCEFGFPLTSNGYDFQRQRKKWMCQKICTREDAKPQVKVPGVKYPPRECPYLDTSSGKVVNVGKRFPDGSMRLVRDVLPGSPEWKKLYRRGRNAVEARNAELQRWNLKRLPVYGGERGRAVIGLADVCNALSTMARLVREATT